MGPEFGDLEAGRFAEHEALWDLPLLHKAFKHCRRDALFACRLQIHLQICQFSGATGNLVCHA